jgi:hypothetical protein
MTSLQFSNQRGIAIGTDHVVADGSKATACDQSNMA